MFSNWALHICWTIVSLQVFYGIKSLHLTEHETVQAFTVMKCQKNKTETRFLIYNESTIKPNGMLNLWAMFSPSSAAFSAGWGATTTASNAVNLTSLLCVPVPASAYTSKGFFFKLFLQVLLIYTGVHGPDWTLRCLPTTAWCKKGDLRFLQTSKMPIREERLCRASTTAKGQVPRRMTLI